MDIEPATVEDADTIADLWVALAADQREYGSQVLPAENRAALQEDILRHAVRDTVLVARGGDIQGFVTLSVDDGGYVKSVRRGVVENLYVRPDHRGQGIGGRLLDAAEQALRERDVAVVLLETLAENEAARRFYARNGYSPHRIQFAKSFRNDTHSKDDE